MTDKKNITSIPVIFQKVDTLGNDDSRFLKVKIWLMHTGENFNGSYFSKEVVNKYTHTLANTPVLAYIEENSLGEEDFSDHRITLEKDSDGNFNFKYLGAAVGVIPENNNARWEMRVTDHGEEKEYLVVDALLWTKWDDPINIMKSRKKVAQSMELSEDYSGRFDENNVFHFERFSFNGACLLGVDYQPGMDSASAEIMFTKESNLQEIIQEKLNEYYSLISKEGGSKMNKEKENLQEEVETRHSEPEKQEEEIKTQTDAPETSSEVDVDVESKGSKEEEKPLEKDSDEPQEEIKSNEEDKKANDKEETVLKSDFDKVAESHKLLAEEYSALLEEVETLKAYKRMREENDLKDKFSKQISEEEFTQVFSEMKDSSIEDIEVKLFALVGQKNFSVKKDKEDVNKALVFSKEEDTEESPYGDLFN
ncbi:hypothetical protein [Siminovitchia sp. 179-K 8D1 HS]|uniref:hypothetical protein n=1 Tax=Siminovitchia sp. 179-K 8D1 HS TaxID=3142385 RepID=UPI0039A0DD56